MSPLNHEHAEQAIPALPITTGEWAGLWARCREPADVLAVLRQVEQAEAERARQKYEQPKGLRGLEAREIRATLADFGTVWTVSLLRHMYRISRGPGNTEWLVLMANPSLLPAQRAWALEFTLREDLNQFNQTLLLLARIPGEHWPLDPGVVARLDAAFSNVKRDPNDKYQAHPVTQKSIDLLLDTAHRKATGEDQRLCIVEHAAEQDSGEYYGRNDELTSAALGQSYHLSAVEALRIWDEWATPGLWWNAAFNSDVTDVFTNPRVRTLAKTGLPMRSEATSSGSKRDQNNMDSLLALACLCAPGPPAPDTLEVLARFRQFHSAKWIAERALGPGRPRVNPEVWKIIEDEVMLDIACTGTAEERVWGILNTGKPTEGAVEVPMDTPMDAPGPRPGRQPRL